MMWVFGFALQVLVIFLVSPSSIILNLTDSVQAFILPDATSPFKHQHKHQQQNHYYRADANVNTARGVSRWVSPSSRNQDRNNNDNQAEREITAIEGLFLAEEEFGRLVAVDETIRALQLQLPTILTKALTPAMVEKVYSKDDFCFSILVDDERGNGGGDILDQDDDGDDRDTTGSKKDDDEIVVLNSREELMALSDVLVLTTAAAQQAILVTGRTADAKVKIECQFIIEDSCQIIRIPWRAKTPTLGALSPTGSGKKFHNFEGITDCYLSSTIDDDDDVGKVERFVVRKASFNGRILNGPAIGQALKRIQSTLSNLQQNPILKNIVRTTTQQNSDDNNNNNNNRATSIFNTLLDGFLDQAATALSTTQTASSKQNVDATTIPVYQVDSIGDLSLVANNGWIQDEIVTADNTKPKQGEILTPCPGTKDWDNYVNSRSCLTRFSNDVIPQLSDLSIVDSKLFADDATYQIEGDKSIVMTGRESLANFFQSMALTRKGTGGSWTMIRYEVLDWKARTVAISYEVTTSSLPLWTIQGRDIYELDTTTSKDDRPIIKAIRQGKMVANGPNGNTLRLDGRWLTENVASAFQGDGTSPSSKLPRDFLTELLMNQPNLSPFLKQQKKSSTRSKSSIGSSRRKLSKSAAAASYYIMSDLYEQAISLFDMSSSNRRSPPGAEQMSENIELKGYLGESIVRGSSLYNRSIGSVIFGIRESIRQKRLVIEETPAPPRVELLVPTGEIRLSLTFLFRIPPIGAGILPSQDTSNGIGPGLPLKVELTSDYRIDPDTGLITEHRLVETRINGQLTAGDQVSRWMQRFLKLDVAAATTTVRNEDGGLTAIMDAISWFRSM
jgi:hypothetical protein